MIKHLVIGQLPRGLGAVMRNHLLVLGPTTALAALLEVKYIIKHEKAVWYVGHVNMKVSIL